MSELAYVCALDLETSGLDEQRDAVLEVAALFGQITADGWREFGRIVAILPLPPDGPAWNPRVVEMHTRSGLLAEVMGSGARPAEECDLALETLACVGDDPAARWTLLGNSVHFDLRFVRRVFPRFAARLSHRVIDVSAIRLFCESLGMPPPEVKPEPAHRALDDVTGSLRLFAEYRRWIRDAGGVR